MPFWRLRHRVWPVAALAMGLLVSASGLASSPATGGRTAGARVGSIPPSVGTAVPLHGRRALHEPLVLPAAGPYGVRSKARHLPLHDAPWTGSRVRIDTHNPLGQQFRLPVTAVRRSPDGSGWLRVLLPDEWYGTSAWVRSDDVRVVTLHERLVMDLSSFTLRHYRDGKLIRSFRVGIGRPEYPTPTGRYFIWAQVPQSGPNGPYGVFALATSAFSPVIDDGRVGIHGTANPGDRGRRVSHGCIRVYNADMVKLERVPLGTPFVIRP